MAKRAELTIEEAIATLQRSGLSSVIAEGDDDFLVLRGVEERCADLGVSIFPVGGKEKALQIWNGLELSRRNNTLVVVDQDLWFFEGTPDEYNVRQIVTTNGFSIENDLRADWNWEALMTRDERTRFAEELRVVSRWFGARVSKRLAGDDVTIADHPNVILKNPEDLEDDPLEIEAHYVIRLRGKTLIELAVRQLSDRRRRVKHSKRALMETAASFQGPNMSALEAKVREFFEVNAA